MMVPEMPEFKEVISSFQSAAQNRFAKMGLPSVKDEGWRHSALGPLLREGFEFGNFADVSTLAKIESSPTWKDWEARILSCPMRLVIWNGRVSAEKSAGLKEHGLKVSSLDHWLGQGGDFYRIQDFKVHRDDGFLAVAQADTGASQIIEVESDFSSTEPLHVFFLQDETGKKVVQTNLYLLIGERAKFNWVENYLGSPTNSAVCANVTVYATVGASAKVEQFKLFHSQDARYLLARTQVKVKKSAEFASQFMGIGSALSRNEMEIELRETEACAKLNGLFLGNHQQVIDSHTFIRHEAPYCTSQQLYKGALKGIARGVFRGRVLVDSGAQKTSAKQSNPNLVLSDQAQVHTKPQLEIFADDVKCSHGATIGKIDAQALFYLRSRGIPKAQAEQMLAEAFASEILDEFRDSHAHDFAATLFQGWLNG